MDTGLGNVEEKEDTDEVVQQTEEEVEEMEDKMEDWNTGDERAEQRQVLNLLGDLKPMSPAVVKELGEFVEVEELRQRFQTQAALPPCSQKFFLGRWSI